MREGLAVADGDQLKAEELRKIEEGEVILHPEIPEYLAGPRDGGQLGQHAARLIERSEAPVTESHDDYLVGLISFGEDGEW